MFKVTIVLTSERQIALKKKVKFNRYIHMGKMMTDGIFGMVVSGVLCPPGPLTRVCIFFKIVVSFSLIKNVSIPLPFALSCIDKDDMHDRCFCFTFVITNCVFRSSAETATQTKG